MMLGQGVVLDLRHDQIFYNYQHGFVFQFLHGNLIGHVFRGRGPVFISSGCCCDKMGSHTFGGGLSYSKSSHAANVMLPLAGIRLNATGVEICRKLGQSLILK